MNPLFTLFCRQPCQQRAHSRRIKDRLCLPQSQSCLSNAQLEPSAIFGGTLPRNIAPPDQPLDVQRHR